MTAEQVLAAVGYVLVAAVLVGAIWYSLYWIGLIP